MKRRKRKGIVLLAGVIRTREWRKVLDGLLAKSGRDLAWLSDYLGAAYNESSVSYYEKLPKRRETYIGIGMAFRQPLEEINRWIVTFANKKRLYIKDVTEDLCWVYLIRTNLADDDPDANYYRRYEDCQAVCQAVYQQVWDEFTLGSLSTADMELEMESIDADNGFAGLKQFIVDHLDSFNTAYARPRSYLDRFLTAIIGTAGHCPDLGSITSLNKLRGYLDDSMVNFLAGSKDTINTIDRATGQRTVRIKHVPKTKRFHISLGLALGMTRPELDEYLDLFGFPPLGSTGDASENALIGALETWEDKHPLPRLFKDRVVFGGCVEAPDYAAAMGPGSDSDTPDFPFRDHCAAVEEMLLLRQELADLFKEQGRSFPYLKQ